MVRAIQIVGTGALGIIAQAAVDPSGTFAGLEKLGIAAVTVAILFWLLRAEREERRATALRLDQLQEEIRRDHTAVISGHAEAMKMNAAAMAENARASVRLAEVMDRRRYTDEQRGTGQ